MIYFDHQSTSQTDPRVVEEMLPYFTEHFGNSLARFQSGEAPRQALEKARQSVADLINSSKEEIIFTSSGSESNNLAVKGVLKAYAKKGKHIVASGIEHSSVRNQLNALMKEGYEVSFVPVDSHGFVDLDQLKKAIRQDTVLVTVTHASNEIGTIEPLSEISKIVHENKSILLADGVQTVGNMPVDVKELGVDLMSMAGHQFYGPKGTGALFVKKGVWIKPMISGGIQENGRRAGTENVPGIVGMGKAAELAKLEMADRMKYIRNLQNNIISGVLENIKNVHLTGHPEQRIPGHVSFTFEFVEGESMLLFLSAEGIEGASGSTCSSHDLKASHVLLAIGLGDLLSQGSLIFSLGKNNTQEDVDILLEKLPTVVDRLRQMSPVDENFDYDKESFKGDHHHH
jgi:cysteine desulfurase